MSEPYTLPAEAPGTAHGAVPVGTLNRLVRETLERSFPLMWVSGEISNLTRAPSGHIYFTLKDQQAQVRCTMWRNRAQTLPFRPENGMRVEARALVTLYEVRGDYQLSVEGLRQAGQGNLFEAFLRLKERLSAEGLFAPELKRPLPRFPRGIGVVTSPAAAALRDVLASLERRVPHLPVTLYPAAVQGADAGPLLARALNTASQRAQADGIDLILLVRGGGSMEDLWAFNDEGLTRAIRACTVPVISGVGHETDFTIADFAADLRAATPTGAAELASAGFHAMHAQLATQASLLQRAMMRRMEGLVQRVDRAALRLVHPRERLRNATRDLAGLQNRLASAMRRHLEQDRSRHAQLALRIKAGRPDIERAGAHVERLGAALRRAVDERLAAQRTTVDTLAAYLQHLDPQAVLGRGYSITRDAHGHILRDATASRPGDPLRIQLAHGQIEARVEDVKP